MSKSNSDNIKLEYTSRGEYKSSTLLSSKINSKKLNFNEILIPNSVSFNDKLGVHKIHSTSLNISIPENKILEILIKNANTIIYGDFEKLTISQNSGQIFLVNWNSPGLLKTISADIVFKNPKVKILSNLESGSNCNNPKSDIVFEIIAVSSLINCVIF